MATNDDGKPITRDMMEIYISVLEKQISQMTLIVATIEELNEKLGKIEDHFNNGFKGEIIERVDHSAEKITEQIERVTTVAATLAVTNEKSAMALSALNEKNSVALAALNDKNTATTIGTLDANMRDVKSAIKISTITNIIGWTGLILTVLLKVFGKF